MKSAIVLVLVVGTVLAAPPAVRLTAKPQVDPFAHIFAQVRPAAQQHNVVDVEIKEHRPESQHHIELELKPVEEKESHHIDLELTADNNLLKHPSHEVDLEIVQHQHQKQEQSQNHHSVDVEIKQHQPENNHYVELEYKPVEEKKQSQHIELELSADNHSKQPSREIDLEIVQHQHQKQKEAQNHLVDIQIKEHQPEIHHVELEVKPVEEKKQSQHMELGLNADIHSKQPTRDIELEFLHHQPQISAHHLELEIVGENSQVPQPGQPIHPYVPKPAFPNPQQSSVQHFHLGPAHL